MWIRVENRRQPFVKELKLSYQFTDPRILVITAGFGLAILVVPVLSIANELPVYRD